MLASKRRAVLLGAIRACVYPIGVIKGDVTTLEGMGPLQTLRCSKPSSRVSE
jgi:hypothetical protein